MLRKCVYAIMTALLLSTQAVADSNSNELSPPDHTLIFQVIQDQFVIDNKTIKSASIIETEDGYRGLHVELTPEAAKVLTELTTAGVGRQANVIFNKVVVSISRIQTPLGGAS